MPHPSALGSDVMLLLASLIWGFAFVAQRVGMEHVGPFLFTGIRFTLGAATLFAVVKVRGAIADGRKKSGAGLPAAKGPRVSGGGLLLGLVLSGGATLQQVGLVYTTAGNAGFITGFYVVLVPLLGLFVGHRIGRGLWIGASLSLVGLYFLSVTEGFAVSQGDLLVFACSFFWALHVLVVDHLTRSESATSLALTQSVVCAALSLVVAAIFEKNSFQGVLAATVPILYGGILSVGVAYTLQIVGQKKAPPAHASILLSLEAAFAAVGGALILGEVLTSRKWLGCFLMFAGMLLAQWSAISGRRSTDSRG
jgi:drug/metabolite transporter (DMT)-like permease